MVIIDVSTIAKATQAMKGVREPPIRSPALEKHYVPNADRIVAEAKKQLGL